MTAEEITRRIREFRDERDWAQFHNPKDMAEAICIEAADSSARANSASEIPMDS
jgi:hypothetical protein